MDYYIFELNCWMDYYWEWNIENSPGSKGGNGAVFGTARAQARRLGYRPEHGMPARLVVPWLCWPRLFLIYNFGL